MKAKDTLQKTQVLKFLSSKYFSQFPEVSELAKSIHLSHNYNSKTVTIGCMATSPDAKIDTTDVRVIRKTPEAILASWKQTGEQKEGKTQR